MDVPKEKERRIERQMRNLLKNIGIAAPRPGSFRQLSAISGACLAQESSSVWSPLEIHKKGPFDLLVLYLTRAEKAAGERQSIRIRHLAVVRVCVCACECGKEARRRMQRNFCMPCAEWRPEIQKWHKGRDPLCERAVEVEFASTFPPF